MSGRSRVWAVVAVAVLLVLNLAVVAALTLRDGPTPVGGGRVDTGVDTPSVPPDVPPEVPAATNPEEAPALLPVVTATRQLVALDDVTAWRATLASCGETASVVERTEDGGATWTPVSPGVDTLVRLRASDAASAFVVGATDGCATALASTDDGGQSWNRADETLSSAWYLAPTDRSVVVGPSGQQPVPCADGVVDLVATGTRSGAVLCTDGTVAVSRDGGRSWGATGAVAGARAIAQRGDGYLVATDEGTCEGLAVHAVDVTGVPDPEPWVCAPVAPAVDVAIAGEAGALWVWSGQELVITRDEGQTW